MKWSSILEPESGVNTPNYKLKRFRFFYLTSSALVLLASIIPVRLAIAAYQVPFPQAILVLGGDPAREEAAAEFARVDPALDVWVSSGTAPHQAHATFRAAGISDTRVHLDYRAVDTLTNFTSLVTDLKRRHIQHVYLITSGFHMPRAKAIATLVLGSQGIAFTPVSVPSDQPPESWQSILRDSGRAIVWIITGRTGASLNSRFESYAP